MADTLTSPSPAPRVAPFIVYVATVLTVAMVLFPPFTSLGGTEYAFVLTGPEWAGRAGSLGAELGLSARVHWARLAVQLGVVWALAYGARRFLAPPLVNRARAASHPTSLPAMHRYLALSLVSALLLLSGCDSGDDGDGEGNGGLALGTITARIDGAAFSSAFAIARPCALCPLVGGDGIEVAGVAKDGTGVGFVLLSFDGAGTYPLGAGESEGVVDLEDGSSFATDLGGSGTVVVTRSTAQAIEGTFSFTAGDGDGGTVRVTEGRFNVPFSGL